MTVRTMSDRIVYEPTHPPHGTPTYSARKYEPPHLVRRSPTRLEDCLLPSIESASSDIASPYADRRYPFRNNLAQPLDSQTRSLVEHRMKSPATRQVIVINDDSPPTKRRRMVEDELGRFKPSSSQVHNLIIPTKQNDPHLRAASYAQSGDFPVQHPRISAPSAQGLFRDTRTMYTDPATSERLPIYDVSESDLVPVHQEHFRGVGIGYLHGEDALGMRRMGPSHPTHDIASESFPGRPLNAYGSEDIRTAERDPFVRQIEPSYLQRPSSPKLSDSQKISCSSGLRSGSEFPVQDFIHHSAQSRLDGPVSRARAGFTVPPENRYQNFISQENAPQQYQGSARSYATIHSNQARSPVRYVELPM